MTDNPFEWKKTIKKVPGNADAASAGYECMTEDCERAASWKGLCSSCYGCARQLVEQNKTTWDELLSMGMCVPKSKPFYVEFHKKKFELEQRGGNDANAEAEI